MSQSGPQNTTVESQITHATLKAHNFHKYSTLLPCPMCFLPICCPFPQYAKLVQASQNLGCVWSVNKGCYLASLTQFKDQMNSDLNTRNCHFGNKN